MYQLYNTHQHQIIGLKTFKNKWHKTNFVLRAAPSHTEKQYNLCTTFWYYEKDLRVVYNDYSPTKNIIDGRTTSLKFLTSHFWIITFKIDKALIVWKLQHLLRTHSKIKYCVNNISSKSFFLKVWNKNKNTSYKKYLRILQFKLRTTGNSRIKLKC